MCMWQNWKGILIDEGNIKKQVEPERLKIMEHSWIEDLDLLNVYYFIKSNPQRIYWVGEYANSVIPEITPKLAQKEFMEIYKMAYVSQTELPHVPVVENAEENYAETGYLINHTKREYLDMAKYCTNSASEYGWIINPLPLLVAIPGNNGQGGGEYFGKIGQELVGYWSGDVISFEDNIPESFNELEAVFKTK